ncbi:MAG: hypothetical protein JRE28_13145 [Deltaproteobacteria bacterium]|nr:hypothetical protein [Deltaproteobacteria bacterium]
MAPKISNHSPQSHVNSEWFHFRSDLQFERNPILILNEAIDNLHVPHEVNEQAIDNFLEDLEAYDTSFRPAYWLMTARLFELSLICAGHYADNCEFSAAGDLLVNPRKVLIHRRGYPHPLVKQRHGRLTEQLNIENKCIFQVKREVTVEVAKPPILPYLFERMERSRQIASWYLHDAQERMKKIADTIGFLSAWSLSEFEVLHNRMQKMSAKTRRFVADHQCNFDTSYFVRLGREIPIIIGNPQEYSEVLSQSAPPEKPET